MKKSIIKRKQNKLKEIEGYTLIDNYEYNNNAFDENSQDSIIDEIIKSLDNEEIDKKDLDDSLTDTERKNIISEYEIVMNCDDSDYIVYYKKRNKS